MKPSALRVADLSKHYGEGSRTFHSSAVVQALRPLSLEVSHGETLGIVGESGCGKTTLARMLAGLQPPSSGSIEINGRCLDTKKPSELGHVVQYVFQDPVSSLNPRKSIRQVLAAPLRYLLGLDDAKIETRISELLNAVNLDRELLKRYPHELSGGQAQRILIARALAANPRILILDEPVSALDVSVQAQILNLLSSLKSKLNLTYLFISHDLAVVEAISDRIAVLYFGSLVEIGPSQSLFTHPLHPYTKLLLESAPAIDRKLVGKQTDELPDPLNPPPGCSFARRCPFATDMCINENPLIRSLEENRAVACHHPLTP
ncbi:MAG: ATP-binding cassette domain-containing protein [Hyphomicrobiales bacterium]|nr:ATP-binding cassette domain-containing protein [Hyphomicrobiales bacterium]